MHPLLFRTLSIGLLALAASACGEEPATTIEDETLPPVLAEPPKPPRQALAELGSGDQSPDSVVFTPVATFADGLRRPRDLDFNPRNPDQLWIVNYDDDGMVIVHDASKNNRLSEKRIDDAANHFMAFPSSLAFGADPTTFGKLGTFATCQESRNTYGGQAAANDFMGPALWSSDLSVFAVQNPHGLGSHIDMLHGSPNCMGIAHERDNVYWVFGGKKQEGGARQQPTPAIVRYDFAEDHDIGQDDHSDGAYWQYVTNEVSYVPGIPSHLEFDPTDRMLYIADTGNSRVVALDTESGVATADLSAQEPLVEYKRMEDATLEEIIPSGVIASPSGLELKNDLLFISDNATGKISAFNKQGELVNQLDTGLGAGTLAGMTFGPDGKLYFVDMLGNQVLRIDPK